MHFFRVKFVFSFNFYSDYLPIGISLGVVFGICFDNIGIGICLGVGAALSLFPIS